MRWEDMGSNAESVSDRVPAHAWRNGLRIDGTRAKGHREAGREVLYPTLALYAAEAQRAARCAGSRLAGPPVTDERSRGTSRRLLAGCDRNNGGKAH